MELTRRHALGALVASTSATILARGGFAMAGEEKVEPKKTGELRPGQHVPVPLPFDAKKLRGISERMITSHWEYNYSGAVRNLNRVEVELLRVAKGTEGFLVSGLKERELTFTNSVILHELYFGNLGGDGRAGGAAQAALAEAYGSFARWEELFRATGLSIAGGSGWTVLDWNLHTGAIRTYWSGNHTQALAFGAPLLVMDMYEHAYQMEYGAAAAKYVDAFFQNLNWDEVNKRMGRAKRASAALHAG